MDSWVFQATQASLQRRTESQNPSSVRVPGTIREVTQTLGMDRLEIQQEERAQLEARNW